MLMTGLFGWAKPVPVNPSNLRNPKRGLMLISLAGPLSNIMLALCCGFIIRIFFEINPRILIFILNGYLLQFLMLAFMINAGLAFFNLLPFYPLDGSKVLAWFLPDKYIPHYMHITRHALPVIFALVIIGSLTGTNFLSTVLNPVFKPFIYLLQLAALGDGKALF
jgi:Zn-dependent protease